MHAVTTQNSVSTFFHKIFPEYYGFILSRAIYVMTKLRIAHLLESGPLSAGQLCENLGTGQILRLEKVLQFVQQHGFFQKNSAGCYENTSESLELLYDRSGRKIVEVHELYWNVLQEADVKAVACLQQVDLEADTRALELALQFIPARALYIACKIDSFSLKPLEQRGYAANGKPLADFQTLLHPLCRAFILHEIPERWHALGHLEEALMTKEVPFERLYGQTLFSHLKTKPELTTIFADAMTCICEYECRAIAHELEPYMQPGDTLIDVGGGRGRYMQEILQHYPEAKGILFDLEENVKSHIIDAETARRCQFVGGDFFKSVPEADIYHFKRVLHDWSDSECIEILKSCARSACASSRVVLHELLLPQSEALMLDIYFMTLFKGKQRDLATFEAIFAASGWKLESVKRTDSWLAQIVAIKS